MYNVDHTVVLSRALNMYWWLQSGDAGRVHLSVYHWHVSTAGITSNVPQRSSKKSTNVHELSTLWTINFAIKYSTHIFGPKIQHIYSPQ